MAIYWYNSMLCKFSDSNYECHNDLATRSNSTGRIRPASKTPLKQKRNVKPGMATYWYNSMLCKFSDSNYECHNDLRRSNSTGLKNTFETAQKRNVKPGMAIYWYNSMLCKFSDSNYECHNDLATRSNSTGRIRPASKTPLKRHKKEMLSLVWLYIGTIVCCASFQTQIMSATTI